MTSMKRAASASSSGSERNKKVVDYGVSIRHHLEELAKLTNVSTAGAESSSCDAAGTSSQSSGPPNKKQCSSATKKTYWTAGTGFGVGCFNCAGSQKNWSVAKHLCEQENKDKKVSAVLLNVALELQKFNEASGVKITAGKRGRRRGERGPKSGGRAAGPYGGENMQQASSQMMRCGAVTRSQSRLAKTIITDVEEMKRVLLQSALLPVVKSFLAEDTVLEMSKHLPVYESIVEVIKQLVYSPSLACVVSGDDCGSKKLGGGGGDNVLKLLVRMRGKALAMLSKLGRHGLKHPDGSLVAEEGEKTARVSGKSKKYAGEDGSDSAETFSKKILNLCDFCDAAEEHLAKHLKFDARAFHDEDMDTNKSRKDTDFSDPLETAYQSALKPLQFSANTFEGGGHHYDCVASTAEPRKSQILRVVQELECLSTSLPLHRSSAVFVRSNENQISLLQVLITGPEGTPYSSGCFLFDVYFPGEYPAVPPKVQLRTTGNGTVRFNPNLYATGMVCLSLLGTWPGRNDEMWNKTSTLLQVLVSIQSLILVPEPYFNEPGFEKLIGTKKGKQQSQAYNIDIMKNTMKYAMRAQLDNPSPGFEEVIRSHFYMKKEQILKECGEWVEKYSQKDAAIEYDYKMLKEKLDDLAEPESCKFKLEKDCGGGGGENLEINC